MALVRPYIESTHTLLRSFPFPPSLLLLRDTATFHHIDDRDAVQMHGIEEDTKPHRLSFPPASLPSTSFALPRRT